MSFEAFRKEFRDSLSRYGYGDSCMKSLPLKEWYDRKMTVLDALSAAVVRMVDSQSGT